jgi:hypothetical protein
MKRKSQQTTSATPPYETSNVEDDAKGVVNGEVNGEVNEVDEVGKICEVSKLEVGGVNGDVI